MSNFIFKKLANQTLIYGVPSVIGRFLNYLLVPIYSRIFLPKEYGIVTELYAYAAFFSIILLYGMETSFFRFYKDKKHKNTSGTIIFSVIFTSLVFTLFSFLSAEKIANWFNYTTQLSTVVIYIKIFIFILSIDSINTILFTKIRADEKPIKFATIKTINIFFNIFFNIYFLIILGKTEIVYIFYSNLIATIVSFILLFPGLIKTKLKLDLKLLKQILFYGIPLLLAGFAGIINEAADRILLKKFLSTESNVMHEIGVYGACYKLSIAIVIFLQAYKLAVEPMIFDKKNMNKIIYAKMLNYFVIVGTVILLIILMYIDYFKFFIGPKFHEGIIIVPILLFANLFFGIYYSLSVWYKITDKTIYGAVFSVSGAIITIIINIIFIPEFGYLASAWATFICFFSMALLSYIVGRKNYKIPYNIPKITTYLFLSFVFYKLSLLDIQIISKEIIRLFLLFTYMLIIFIIEKKYSIYENKNT